MQTILEDLDPKLLQRTRTEMTPIHEKLSEITEDPERHNRLLKVAIFTLPAEKGKAGNAKSNMTNFYGNDPRIAGFVFSVARSVDGNEEYLAVQFVPELIEEGAWDAFQEEKAIKAQLAKERADARAAEKTNGAETVADKVAQKVAANS